MALDPVDEATSEGMRSRQDVTVQVLVDGAMVAVKSLRLVVTALARVVEEIAMAVGRRYRNLNITLSRLVLMSTPKLAKRRHGSGSRGRGDSHGRREEVSTIIVQFYRYSLTSNIGS